MEEVNLIIPSIMLESSHNISSPPLSNHSTITAMHNVFQQDLAKLRLDITRAYAKAVSNNLTPITSNPDCSLKITAQVR